MRLDLSERLVCPHPHESSPLVVVAQRVDGRELLEGFAGCPVCRLEARIVGGDVRFALTGRVSSPDASLTLAASPERIDRTLALLGLAEPGGAVLVSGRYAPLAAALAARGGTAMIVAEGASPVPRLDGVAAFDGAGAIVPFAAQTFRAAALDPPLADAVRTLAAAGRLLAPSAHPLPSGLRELARDDEEWVAERELVVPVELRRARP